METNINQLLAVKGGASGLPSAFKQLPTGVQRLSGGLNVAEGVHTFVMSDQPDACIGVYFIAKSNWALPCIAGILYPEDGSAEIAYSLGDQSKLLIVTESIAAGLQPATEYSLTVGKDAKGNKRVIAMEMVTAAGKNIIKESKVKKPTSKKKEEAF